LPEVDFLHMKIGNEIVVNVTEPWMVCIEFCKLELPSGTLRIVIENGSPAEHYSHANDRNIHFGKPWTLPRIYRTTAFRS